MQLHSLLSGVSAVTTGSTLTCNTTPFNEDRQALLMFEYSNFEGTVKFQTSDDGGSTWADTISITKVAGNLTHQTATLDTSAGGSNQTTNLQLLPAESVMVNVKIDQTVAMDGDTTTTCEVGVTGNIDAYIDTVDFDPSVLNSTSGSAGGTTNDVKTSQFLESATQLIATWTNTANMTAGTALVTTTHFSPELTAGGDSDTREVTLTSLVRASVSAISGGSVTVSLVAEN